MVRTFLSIIPRSWEMGIARCRKVMQWNSKLCKDQKGHKQQTYRKQQPNSKRNHGAGGDVFCRPFHLDRDGASRGQAKLTTEKP